MIYNNYIELAFAAARFNAASRGLKNKKVPPKTAVEFISSRWDVFFNKIMNKPLQAGNNQRPSQHLLRLQTPINSIYFIKYTAMMYFIDKLSFEKCYTIS